MNLIISNKKVRTKDNLYCLNDLHKASGGENKKRPSLWLENKQTKELIDEIVKAGNPASGNPVIPVSSVKGGRGSATYATKELVYSYAMWISPAFHLHVIKAYDALVTGQLQEVERKQSRNTARLEAPVLNEAIKYSKQTEGKEAKHYHYSNEYDMINRIVLGMTSKKYRQEHEMEKSDPIRDHLTAGEIKAIEHLQSANTTMIELDMPYEKRKSELNRLFLTRHHKELCEEIKRLEA